MCGLCGVLSTNLVKTEVEAFQHLMAVSTLRGSYGSGMIIVPAKENTPYQMIRDEQLTAAELAHSGVFYGKMEDVGATSLLMGHARAPTTGGLTLEDTHPHEEGHILGMHNGTMEKIAGTKFKQVKDGPSDSKLLFQAIANQGVEQTIENSDGAYALTYINTKTETLNFLRNADRGLYWARVGKIQTIYWASEADFLRLVLSRLYPHQTMELFRFPTDEWITFDVRLRGDFACKTRKTVKPKKGSLVPAIAPTHKVERMYTTRDGKYVTQDDLQLLLMNGCVYCGQQEDFAAYQKGIHWIEEDIYVCHQCALCDEFARSALRQAGLTPPKRGVQ